MRGISVEPPGIFVTVFSYLFLAKFRIGHNYHTAGCLYCILVPETNAVVTPRKAVVHTSKSVCKPLTFVAGNKAKKCSAPGDASAGASPAGGRHYRGGGRPIGY